MRKTRKIISVIITIALVFSMIIGNITFVFAQESGSSVDTAELEELYNRYKDVERGTYSHGSWMYFKDALDFAYWVLYESEEITADMVDWAHVYLKSAYPTLEEYDGSPVDFSALESAYNKYKDVKQENYNQASWNYFMDALEEARLMLYEYEFLHQRNIDSSLEILEEAHSGLEEGEPNFTQLEEVYNQYKDLEQGDYNQGSWSMFEQMLNWVKDLLTDPYERESATQSYIDSLLEELLMYFERLETGDPDLKGLEQLFDQFNQEYKDINPEKFLTNPGDIELFEYIISYVPFYLDDYREYATHYETDELIQSIKELQEKLTKTNDDANPNPKEEEEDNPEQDGKSDPKGDEGDPAKEGNGGSKEEQDDPVQDDNSGSEEKDNHLDSDSKTFQNQATDKNGLENRVDVSRKTAKEYVPDNLLPNTSTNNYNMMVLGLIFIVEGIFLYLYFNFLSFLRRRFNLF